MRSKRVAAGIDTWRSDGTGRARLRTIAYGSRMGTELPDFHIPHLEKIEWMIETSGWALEPVLPDADADPPRGVYAYTIGIPELTGFPEIAVFGLTPVAARGLLDLVVDLLEGGTEIPIGSEFVGLFDNDLRSIFLPIDVDKWAEYLRTAVAWHKGAPFEMVQLLWPDRIGFLPTEAGYAHHLRLAQPVLGELP